MKKLTILLAIVLIALNASAQLLWKVSGNGLERPSYIFGTHHFAPSSMLDQLPGMQQAIDDCDVVYGEVDKDSLMSQAVQLKMAQAMIAPPDSTLDKLYSPEGYSIVEKVFNKYFETMGVKLPQMNRLKPNAISTQMQAMQMMKYFPDFDMSNQIDMGVQQRVAAAGKPTAGLETVDEQINLLFNSSLRDQAADLLETCKQDDQFLEITTRLSEAYLAQDLATMQSLLTDPQLGDSEQQLEHLLYNRNRQWVVKLRDIMPKQSVLVCVGAGHLVGELGLLNIFRNLGYTVEPMK